MLVGTIPESWSSFASEATGLVSNINLYRLQEHVACDVTVEAFVSV